MDPAINQNPASRHFQRNLFFLGALVFLVTGMFSGSRTLDRGFTNRDAAKFERILHKKEVLLNREFAQLKEAFAEDSAMNVLDRRSSEYQDLANRQGISIFFFEKGVLKYWSDHSIPIPAAWSPRLNKPFIPDAHLSTPRGRR